MEWYEVYQESLKLVEAYQAAEFIEEEFDGQKRYVLDAVKEKVIVKEEVEFRYWESCGDLKSKQVAESFKLYDNVKYYRRKQSNKQNDILLSFIEKQDDAVNVFYSKTQGKNYHKYIMAIAILIESRFPFYACVHGNISRGQATEAIEWANTVLKNPVDLPVRVNQKQLFDRVLKIVEKEKVIDVYNDLIITEQQYYFDDNLIDNLEKSEIMSWFTNEFNSYDSISQLGAKKLMIQFLNSNQSLEDLCEICCLRKDGPRFNAIEFLKALTSTWIFVNLKYRGCMEVFQKPAHMADTVTYQFATIFLDMEYVGRNMIRYIPLEEGIKQLKQKLKEDNEIYIKIANKNEEITKKLKMDSKKIEKKITKIEEQFEECYEKGIINSIEGLINFNEDFILSDLMIEILSNFRSSIVEAMKSENKTIRRLTNNDDKSSLMRLLIRASNEKNILLTRWAWDWIESIEDLSLLRKIVFMIAMCNNSELRTISGTLLENKALFIKFMQ